MTDLDTAFETWANASSDFDQRHYKDLAWEKYCFLRDKGLPTDAYGKALYYIPGCMRVLAGRKISPITLFTGRKLQ